MSDDDGNPSYRLVPVVRTPEIDPGEPIEIALYASGYGEIKKSKLFINHAHPYLVDEDDPGEITFNVLPAASAKTGEEFSAYFAPLTGDSQVDEISTVGNIFDISPILKKGYEVDNQIQFMEKGGAIKVEADSEYEIGEIYSKPEPTAYADLLSENSHFGYPPIQISLNTKEPLSLRDYLNKDEVEYCHPGDYSITLTLTYGDEKEVHQHQSEINVHVNSWYERNRATLQAAAVIAALITVTPLVVEGLYLFYQAMMYMISKLAEFSQIFF